ncbi:hypothetical protein HY382_01445 [Candidatus Curtissbacteria bacterium]|nr:hypothetical protein [Candidatus Curtissbacteria bacterium]
MPKKLRMELIRQLVTLSTAGFGFVAALAWNEAIQTFVNEYIAKYVAVGPVIVSKFIYAVIITSFAVFVTYQLSKLVKEE